MPKAHSHQHTTPLNGCSALVVNERRRQCQLGLHIGRDRRLERRSDHGGDESPRQALRLLLRGSAGSLLNRQLSGRGLRGAATTNKVSVILCSVEQLSEISKSYPLL